MRMKILFLDDIPQRWHTFTAGMPEEHLNGCEYAETYDAAVALVKKNGSDYYTHYFLDHDLNDEDYAVVTEAGDQYGEVVEGSKNGTLFARFLVSQNVKCDTIVCHSLNPAGRANMQSILSRCADVVHNCPFAWQTPEKFI